MSYLSINSCWNDEKKFRFLDTTHYFDTQQDVAMIRQHLEKLVEVLKISEEGQMEWNQAMAEVFGAKILSKTDRLMFRKEEE